MGNNGNQSEVYKKLRTNIVGLDELLFGGLHLHPKDQNGKSVGTVIAIRGEDAIHKLQFAMHLMCGITKSLRKEKKDTSYFAPQFFSFITDDVSLNDMCIDFQISNAIYSYFERERMGDTNQKNEKNEKKTFEQVYFKENPSLVYNIPLEEGLKNEVYYYNPRTKHVHARIKKTTDDQEDISVCRRKSDEINGYFDDWDKVKKSLVSEAIEGTVDNFKKAHKVSSDCEAIINAIGDANVNKFEKSCVDKKITELRADTTDESIKSIEFEELNKLFADSDKAIRNKLLNYKISVDCKVANGMVNVQINSHLDHANLSTNSLANFQKILETIQRLIESGLNEKKVPCIVIHGFSIFTDDELKRLPLAFLVTQLRKIADVSILVFDNRAKELSYNPDMYIDMRRNDERYLFHELRICENSYQVAALGWHQYKLRKYGIDVFPSLHRVIQKRDYLSYIEHSIYSGKILFTEILDRCDANEDVTEQLYKDWKLQSLKDDKQGKQSDIFTSIIYDLSPNHDYRMQKLGNQPLKPRRKITALVGNPNTYKRVFSNIRLYHNCSECKEHTLVILFDKEQIDSRVHFKCPFTHNNDSECKKCEGRIHFFNIRMGGILPGELFYKIRQILQWRFVNDNQGRTSSDSTTPRITNIIIDDLQKIDYSFPFLKEELLFLPALIALCKDQNIGLQVLCDKRASMCHALCAHADEVLIFEREGEDSVSINVRRSPEIERESEIHRFIIKNPTSLIQCTNDGISYF